MNIVYACDDNFAEIMGVSILSLLEHNANDLVNIHILENRISQENKEKLNKLVSLRQGYLFFHSMLDVTPDCSALQQDRGSISQFSRLWLSHFLSTDRILYLDCDTLICDSLNEFYNQNLEGNIVAALCDCVSKQHRQNIGLKENEVYFNSGVMLIDLNAWKTANIESKFVPIILQYEGKVPYADQGLLNIALRHQVKIIEPRYNCMSIFTEFTFDELLEYRQPSCCYSSFDIEKARDNPAILHFVTLFCIARPWVKNVQGVYFDRWRECKNKSPWATLPFRKDARKKIHRILASFYKNTPKWVSLPVIGLLHSRIKPQWRRFL